MRVSSPLSVYSGVPGTLVWYHNIIVFIRVRVDTALNNSYQLNIPFALATKYHRQHVISGEKNSCIFYSHVDTIANTSISTGKTLSSIFVRSNTQYFISAENTLL